MLVDSRLVAAGFGLSLVETARVELRFWEGRGCSANGGVWEKLLVGVKHPSSMSTVSRMMSRRACARPCFIRYLSLRPCRSSVPGKPFPECARGKCVADTSDHGYHRKSTNTGLIMISGSANCACIHAGDESAVHSAEGEKERLTLAHREHSAAGDVNTPILDRPRR